MIQFRCGHCDVRLKVPQAHAGRQARCPRCKATIRIPQAAQPEPAETETSEYTSDGPAGPSDRGLPDRATPPAAEPATASAHTPDPGDDVSTTASHPLLYPLNVSGVIHVLIFSLCPPLWAQAATAQFWMSPGIGPLLFLVLLTMYFVHYASACLSDSASGGVRAADVNSDSTPLSLDALTSTFQTIFPVVALIWGPPIAYYVVNGQTDWILIVWLTAAGFLFPMAILSVNYFDSIRGANPILVLPSIASVFVPYCMLMVRLFGLAALGGLLMYLSVGPNGICALRPAMIYVLLVQIHLLGRFYCRYEDRLAWDI